MKREHLGKAHGMIAETLRDDAQHHRDSAENHKTAMGKAVAGNPEHEYHKAQHAEHTANAARLDEQAAAHEAECEACSKATEDELNKLVPSNFSIVTPNAPNIRAVPRAGQKDVSTPQLEPAFAKILGTNLEDEE
jgi:hypothetical protein